MHLAFGAFGAFQSELVTAHVSVVNCDESPAIKSTLPVLVPVVPGTW